MKLPGVNDQIALRFCTQWLASLTAFSVDLRAAGYEKEAEGLVEAGVALIHVWCEEFGQEATERALKETERMFDEAPNGHFSGEVH